MRDEARPCALAAAHRRPEHFEEHRDRRPTEFVTRGKPGGRGQCKPEKPKPGRLRKDGTPWSNAAEPKPVQKPPKTVEPGTVKHELTVRKRVIDHRHAAATISTSTLNSARVKPDTIINVDAGGGELTYLSRAAI